MNNLRQRHGVQQISAPQGTQDGIWMHTMSVSGGNTINGIVHANTAEWDSMLSIMTANSGLWGDTRTTLGNASGGWDLVYATVVANSASWEESDDITALRDDIGASSGNWNSTFTTVESNSGLWNDTRTTLAGASAGWSGSQTTVASNSGAWNDTRTTLGTSSGNWNLVYATVVANSASWEESADITALRNDIGESSGNWNSTFTTVGSNSGNWQNTETTVAVTSASWSSAYTTLGANSGLWDDAKNTLASSSGNWNSAFTTLGTSSGNWNDTRTTLGASSGNWNSVFSTVGTNSGDWQNTKTTVATTSADWNSAFTTLGISSGNWNDTRTTLGANSGLWNDTRTTLDSSSGNWNSVFTTVGTASAGWSGTQTTVASNSGLWNDTRTTLGSTSANWNNTRAVVGANSGIWTDAHVAVNELNLFGILDKNKFSVAYDETTRVFTLTIAPSGQIRLNGTLLSPTSQTMPAHDALGGDWFLKYNSAGTLVVTQTIWNLMAEVPVAYVYYNATTGKALLFDERHSDAWPKSLHRYEHLTTGAKLIAGGIVSDYVLNTGTSGALQYAVSEGTIYDEDLVTTLTGLSGTQLKRVMYRSGLDTSGEFSWNDTANIGILGDGTDLYYNQLNAGTWALTPIATNNRWVNYYICAIQTYGGNFQYFAIMGQAIHSSLALAQAEDPITGISWGPMQLPELYILGKFTYRRVSAGAGAGSQSAQIASFVYYRTSSITIAGLSPTNHNSLAGRDVPNSHPGTAVAYDPSITGMTAISQQTAVDELYSRLTSASAVGQSAYTSLGSASGDWNLVYATVVANSASWEESADITALRDDIGASSGNWNSTYSTVLANSGLWALSGIDTDISDLANASGDWNSSFVTLGANSGLWDDTRTALAGASAGWNGTQTAVADNSGDWNLVYATVVNNSASWEESADITALRDDIGASSGNWNSAFTTLGANSGNWQDVGTTVADNSGAWGASTSLGDIPATSGNWNSAYTTVRDNSGSWDETPDINNLGGASGNWNSAYTTVGANSGTWGSGGIPTQITVTNEVSDTSCYMTFFTEVSGDLAPKTNVNLKYNSSTGDFGTVSINGIVLSNGAGGLSGNISVGTFNMTTIGVNSSSNISIGNGTLTSLGTNCQGNIGIGAGVISTVGNSATYNVAIGYTVMTGNTVTGSNNVSIGTSAGRYLKAGASNVFLGNGAGSQTTDGTGNISIGTNSLDSNLTGNYSIAIGLSALDYSTGDNNIGIGSYAGRYSTESNVLYVDGFSRGNTAGDKAGAILYGVMSATPASQTLTTNSLFTATYGLSTPLDITGRNISTTIGDFLFQAQGNITGGGLITLSATGYLKWSTRFIIIGSGGNSTIKSEAGLFFFNIECPPATTTITGVGGCANATATADGIPVPAWSSLYYILPIGSGYASVATNFRLCTYSAEANIPSNWVKICTQNSDTGGVMEFSNGIKLKVGTSWDNSKILTLTGGDVKIVGGTCSTFYVVNTADVANTSSSNLADAFGASALTAGKTYHYRFRVIYKTASYTTGALFSVNCSSAPTDISINTLMPLLLTSNMAPNRTKTLDAGVVSTATGTGAGDNGLGVTAEVWGYVVVNASTTLMLRFRSEANGSAVTIMKGSVLELLQVD